MSPMPKLERSSESMPRLMGNDDSRSKASSKMLSIDNRLNQSVEMIKPLRNESSLMKIAGSNILGANNFHRRSSSTIDYNFKTSDPNTMSKKDPYGDITVQNMMQTEAKAQFEGVCVKYPVPDTQNKLYKIHG